MQKPSNPQIKKGIRLSIVSATADNKEFEVNRPKALPFSNSQIVKIFKLSLLAVSKFFILGQSTWVNWSQNATFLLMIDIY
jgi:hypothetical protein